MGVPPIPPIVEKLPIYKIKDDLLFIKDFLNYVSQVVLTDRENTVFSLASRDPEARSFKYIIQKAASIDVETDIVPLMFSTEVQNLCLKNPSFIYPRREFIRNKVDWILSLVAKAHISDPMREIVTSWDTTPIREIRKMWRDELVKRAVFRDVGMAIQNEVHFYQTDD